MGASPPPAQEPKKPPLIIGDNVSQFRKGKAKPEGKTEPEATPDRRRGRRRPGIFSSLARSISRSLLGD